MTIQLTQTQLFTLVKETIDEELNYGEDIRIRDEDDLHDFILFITIGDDTIEEYDYFYFQAVGLIPRIIDDVIDYINDALVYDTTMEEQWRVYYSQIAL